MDDWNDRIVLVEERTVPTTIVALRGHQRFSVFSIECNTRIFGKKWSLVDIFNKAFFKKCSACNTIYTDELPESGK
ncbi:MAG: hypothetical protein P8Y45_14365, partial [Exilibacterium sp.]